MSQFTVTYTITVDTGEEIDRKIEAICLEQSVELPGSVVSDGIYDRIVGKPAGVRQTGDNQFIAGISWPVENIGNEITQFLNVLFGNISLVPGIQITDLDWPALPQNLFPGPAHGIGGIREKLGIHERAISCTALKPMGLSASELAALARDFAAGGIDIIKDDHGLADQSYAPFEVRLKACTEAIDRVVQKTGRKVWYVPHITAGGGELWRRYELAKKYGAGAVMICPQLTDPEAISKIAKSDADALPVMAHPAYSGAYVQDPKHGFSKGFLYGSLWRAMGADFSIYPNHSGRFSFTLEECREINERARTENSPFRPAFPTPGGGMQRDTIADWLKEYGKNTVFLIGGSLYRHPDGLVTAASEIREILEK